MLACGDPGAQFGVMMAEAQEGHDPKLVGLDCEGNAISDGNDTAFVLRFHCPCD